MRVTTAMRVLTLGSESLRRALDRVASREIHVVHVANSAMLDRALRSEPWSVIVLDPTVLRDEHLRAVAAFASAAAIGLLFCAPCTQDAGLAVIVAARCTAVDVIFADSDVDPLLLRLKLQTMRPESACGLLLLALSRQLGSLPRALASSMVRLFGRLPLPASVLEIATSAHAVRRTVDRQIHGSGFRSTLALLDAVRMAWAWDSLRLPGDRSISDAALDCGYSSAHSLRLHSRRLLGVSPRSLAQTTPSAQIVQRLRNHVVCEPRLLATPDMQIADDLAVPSNLRII